MPYTQPTDLRSATNTPAAATQAIAAIAATAGARIVCKRVLASLATGAAAQTPLTVNLRDGATGVGAILASWQVSAIAAGGAVIIDADNLLLVGTAGNAMTLEFSAAGVANSVQSVTLQGFTN